MKKNISIDFDGVIHDKLHPVPGRKMGPPIRGAKESLEELGMKYTIIVFCVWADSDRNIEVIQKFMEYYQLPFDFITNVKQKSEYYIDDNGVRFTNWDEMLEKVL